MSTCVEVRFDSSLCPICSSRRRSFKRLPFKNANSKKPNSNDKVVRRSGNESSRRVGLWGNDNLVRVGAGDKELSARTTGLCSATLTQRKIARRSTSECSKYLLCPNRSLYPILRLVVLLAVGAGDRFRRPHIRPSTPIVHWKEPS